VFIQIQPEVEGYISKRAELEFAQTSFDIKKLLYFQACWIETQKRNIMDRKPIIQIDLQNSLFEDTRSVTGKIFPLLNEVHKS
jgi:hypothetical protein